MRYILAKTTGRIEIDDEGYAVGELKPEKAPRCDASYIAYSPDQAEVIVRCFDSSVSAEEFGRELSASEAKTLYEQWQNDWDAKCTCHAKTHAEATYTQLNKPCMADVFAGVCHQVIDESQPKRTEDYDEWRTRFDRKKREEFVSLAEDRVRKRKEREIVEIATSIRSEPSVVKESLDKVIVTKQEIDTEIDSILREMIASAKYSLIKHPLKMHKVPF